MIVVDVQVPGMNGLQLKRRLAAEGIAIPIIFITAYGKHEFRRQAMQAGFAALLDKPFRGEQLLKDIRVALNLFEHIMRKLSPTSKKCEKLQVL
jgi:FixJ family two-component response regulator